MTCHTCKYEFCWLCRSKYSYKHFAKFNILGCPGSEFIFIIQDMTNSKRAPFSCPNFYRFLAVLIFIIFGIPLLVIGGVIVGVIIYVMVLLFLPLFFIIVADLNPDNCCLKFILLFFETIVSIALTPLTFLFSPLVAFYLVIDSIGDDDWYISYL